MNIGMNYGRENLDVIKSNKMIEDFKKIKTKEIRDLASLKGDKTLNDKQKLKMVAKQFEGIFVKMMVDSMNKSVSDKNDLLGKSMARNIFKDMLTDERVKAMTKNTSFGIAEMVYNEFTNPGIAPNAIQKKSKREIDVDITPLVDVIFLLLIFFMIGYTQRDQVMEVNLPSSSYSKESQDQKDEINLFLKKDGELLLNKKEIDITQLSNGLQSVDRKKNINLRADKDVSYQNIVSIMAELGKLGFKKLQLNTEKKQ